MLDHFHDLSVVGLHGQQGWCKGCSRTDGRGHGWGKKDCSRPSVPVSTPRGFLLCSDARGTRADPAQFPFMLILQRLGEPKWHRTAVPSGWKGAPGSRVLSRSRRERRLRTPPAPGLLGALPLALASFHDDQKGVENIYTNRLRAAVLMKHLCTRQTLNCPKMGHMCFINIPL